MTFFASILVFALTRAEILERMRAPVVTQAEGLVQVFASCPEDMRREYQMPIASFAAETVKSLYRGLNMRPERFSKARIIIHVGSVRTNLPEIVAKADSGRTRIYVKAPGYADIGRLRTEITKAFFRAVKGEELDDAGAARAFRRSRPELRIADEREELERWIKNGEGDDERNLALMRRILKPGEATRRDVLIFASRLFLYPAALDRKFCGRYDNVSFKEAATLAKEDPSVRLAARRKADEIVVFGGGRGEELSAAAAAYRDFLLALAAAEPDGRLEELLDAADVKLNVAFEGAVKTGGEK
ncbi:MAG: hypothetical protein IKZ22_08850 [Kiritimatiellae bacterium]|nr:hypothetical protein [Kiritimatiellia bacterium]